MDACTSVRFHVRHGLRKIIHLRQALSTPSFELASLLATKRRFSSSVTRRPRLFLGSYESESLERTRHLRRVAVRSLPETQLEVLVVAPGVHRARRHNRVAALLAGGKEHHGSGSEGGDRGGLGALLPSPRKRKIS